MGIRKRWLNRSGFRIGNDDFMEGEIKQNHSRSKGIDADTLPGRIHEYDFFLTRDEEGAKKPLTQGEAEKRSETTEGKRERSKSINFFLPE
jgi:hypothetical protein